MSEASFMNPDYRGFEPHNRNPFFKFSIFLPNFKGLYLLSAKYRELQSFNSVKIESNWPLEAFRTHEVLQVLSKNEL